MKKLLFLALIASLLNCCEKSPDNKIATDYIARIVGFDLNCSTCILEFPENNSQVKKELGESPSNYYQTTNLSKGNYQIGQLVKVKIKKPETNDLKACIALYPSYNYKNVVISEFENFDNLIFNDTIDLPYHDCLYDPENQMYICLDSVLNDSRCPIGAYCLLAGNATVRFKYDKYNNTPIYFNLLTNPISPKFAIINEYKFTLIDLIPYPSLEEPRIKEKLKAQIIVEKIK
jgi:hypothetical protein